MLRSVGPRELVGADRQIRHLAVSQVAKWAQRHGIRRSPSACTTTSWNNGWTTARWSSRCRFLVKVVRSTIGERLPAPGQQCA
jgi:hypothetical protein